MGRNWRPKYKVKCKCGWSGVRASVVVPCPKCGFYYPSIVRKSKNEK